MAWGRWCAIALLVLGSSLAPSEAWVGKVHPKVLEDAERGDADFLVVLAEQADLSVVRRLPTREARGRGAYAELTSVASRTQAPILERLVALDVPHEPYWIANLIHVRAGRAVVEELASRADVLRVDANPRVRVVQPPTDAAHPEGWLGGPQWNLQQIGAPAAWALGYDGSGVVIGGQDTGYDWDHPALEAAYRGWNGTSAVHDFNWHDAIHSGGGSCGADAPVPCDDSQHGTHTMGTMVGDDGGPNQIGVAPGARWIGCRNMDEGFGTPATYTECFQWFVAPTDLAGNGADPSRAPQVINNSWGCPPNEGCSFDTLRLVVENTRDAGIVVVASAGNSGSSCGSIDDPPAIYEASFTVGATDDDDDIAGFSSRGAVVVDSSGRQKPNVSAPGVSVRSSVPGGGYGSASGTSMAGPHVAGAVALLLDANPGLSVEEVETVIERSALARTTSQTCGGVPGSAVPNNTYGWGRLDALAMLTGDADGDGFANLGDCRPTDGTAWADPEAVDNLRLGGGAMTSFSWTQPPHPGASVFSYDLLRSTAASDFSNAECLLVHSSANTAADSTAPAPAFYYLIRVNNACSRTLGTASDGTPRTGAECFVVPPAS